MVEVVLAVQKLAPTGTTPTRNAVATGNTYIVRNSGRVMLAFAKSGAGAAVITVQTPAVVGGLAVAEQTINVPASTGDVMGGPFPPTIYNDGSGDLRFTTSEGTGLTCAVVEL